MWPNITTYCTFPHITASEAGAEIPVLESAPVSSRPGNSQVLSMSVQGGGKRAGSLGLQTCNVMPLSRQGVCLSHSPL